VSWGGSRTGVVAALLATLAVAPPSPTRARAEPSTATTSDSTTTSRPARLSLVGRTREHWIYIDKPSLRKLTSDKYSLWAEIRSSQGDTIKLLMQMNCGERSYLVKSSVNYAEDGSVIDSRTPRSPSLQYVVPDSASEYIHKAICR
jgi:hypothetical protein